jgi:hypothetical protein
MSSWLGNGKKRTFTALDQELIVEMGARNTLGFTYTPDSNWVGEGASLTPYFSLDGGESWVNCVAYQQFNSGNPPSNVPFGTPESLIDETSYRAYVVPLLGGATHFKLKCESGPSTGTCLVEVHAVDTVPGMMMVVPVDKDGNPGRISLATSAGASELLKSEDAAHANGDKGVLVFSRRRDTPAASAGTEGDYQTIDTDGSGKVWTREPTLESFDTAAYGAVSVTGSATQILAAYTGRARAYTLINTHATDTLYLGFDNSVTTSNGFPLVAGASIVITEKSAVYGIRGSSNNIDVRKFGGEFA